MTCGRRICWGILSSEPLTELQEGVLRDVDKLGPSELSTYGEVAARVGTGPRQVGRVLAQVGHLTSWWRVVRADGSSHDPAASVPHWEAEGIPHNGRAVRWRDYYALKHD